MDASALEDTTDRGRRQRQRSQQGDQVSKQARNETERLVKIVRAFARRRVVVLGDMVADEFIYGDISRVSREAPVLILEQTRADVVPGGGANSAANLRALGALPVPVGAVGRDESGSRLIAELRRRRIPTSGLRVVPGYDTPSKSRILAGGVHTRRQQIVRLDRGAAHGELPVRARAALRRALRSALRQADGLLLADYGYGAASPELVAELAAAQTRRKRIVTVDSRGRVVRFRGVTACTPNQEELEDALGLPPLDDDEVAAAGRRLLRRCGNGAVLVTRGAKGMVLFERGRPALIIPAYGSDEVADVTGAGDTVIAVFTLALITGAEFSAAARLANYAAGLVVTKAGTATVTRRELVAAIREDPTP
jgi:rfaE bifunctional protein kinase chain/domain